MHRNLAGRVLLLGICQWLYHLGASPSYAINILATKYDYCRIYCCWYLNKTIQRGTYKVRDWNINTQVLSNCLLMLLTTLTLPSSSSLVLEVRTEWLRIFFCSKTNCAMMSKEDDGMGESILISVRFWVNTGVICQWRYLANYRIVFGLSKIFFQLFLTNGILLTPWKFYMIYFCLFLFPASHSISSQTHPLHTTSTHLEADPGFLATPGF